MSKKTEEVTIELPEKVPAKKSSYVSVSKRKKPRTKQALATRAATRSVKNRWRTHCKSVSKAPSLKVWARKDTAGKEWLKRKADLKAE